jgi:hypothetical protein
MKNNNNKNDDYDNDNINNKWGTALHFMKIKHVGWINNTFVQIYTLYVKLDTQRYDPPNWLNLLDCKTNDKEN